MFRKVRARLDCNEIAKIFFGVNAVNAVKIANTRNKQKNK